MCVSVCAFLRNIYMNCQVKSEFQETLKICFPVRKIIKVHFPSGPKAIYIFYVSRLVFRTLAY